ncbi:MAG: hypothetical protein ACR2GY_03315 [Phycisphaerales bacterium]
MTVRIALPLLAVVIVAIAAGVVVHRSNRATMSTAEVRFAIIAASREGGYLGPFKFRADEYDVVAGVLRNVNASTDDLVVGARTATFEVDAAANTVTILLESVVILRTPPRDEIRDIALERLESYALGPLTWQCDIIE